jgi:hypothetical protein
MGYSSNVKVLTDLDGFETMQEIAFEIQEREDLEDAYFLFPMQGQDPDEFFDYYDVQEDYLCFGFDWVKWYDTYKDVSLFMEILEVANERGVDWQFIRIGESFEDVENLNSDNFYDTDPAVILCPRMEIVYC